MQFIFLVILTGTLGIGVIVLGWMGLAQRRRRWLLARVAHEIGMKFSATDPFDLTRRYAAFALTSAGHSPRAENVLYGRHEGWHLRVFDYRFEAGHGPQRLARRYSVIVVETNLELPPALMWHTGDTEHAPVVAQSPIGQVGPWVVVSGAEFAPFLAEAFADLADAPVSVQTSGQSVMLCWAVRFKPTQVAARMRQAVAGLHALRARSQALETA